MMHTQHLTALVTLAALLLFMVMILRVGGARSRFNITAPSVTGHPEFERHFRVQMNTLEGMVIFLPALWIFAHYWSDLIAAAVGVIWIVGRVIYMISYVRDPGSRSAGFMTQAIATIVLLLGALAGVVWAIIHTGAL